MPIGCEGDVFHFVFVTLDFCQKITSFHLPEFDSSLSTPRCQYVAIWRESNLVDNGWSLLEEMTLVTI